MAKQFDQIEKQHRRCGDKEQDEGQPRAPVNLFRVLEPKQ